MSSRIPFPILAIGRNWKSSGSGGICLVVAGGEERQHLNVDAAEMCDGEQMIHVQQDERMMEVEWRYLPEQKTLPQRLQSSVDAKDCDYDFGYDWNCEYGFRLHSGFDYDVIHHRPNLFKEKKK